MSTRTTFALLLVLYVVGYAEAVRKGGDPALSAWFLAGFIAVTVGVRLAVAWLVHR